MCIIFTNILFKQARETKQREKPSIIITKYYKIKDACTLYALTYPALPLYFPCSSPGTAISSGGAESLACRSAASFSISSLISGGKFENET